MSMQLGREVARLLLIRMHLGGRILLMSMQLGREVASTRLARLSERDNGGHRGCMRRALTRSLLHRNCHGLLQLGHTRLTLGAAHLALRQPLRRRRRRVRKLGERRLVRGTQARMRDRKGRVLALRVRLRRAQLLVCTP